MSGEIDTKITFQGTEDEFEKLSCLLQDYLKGKEGVYIKSVRIHQPLLTNDGTPAATIIDVDGPYGKYFSLYDSHFFQDLGRACPLAYFYGQSQGFVLGANVALVAELKDRQLHIADYYEDDEELPKRYAKIIKKILPYSTFCELLKVDQKVYTRKDYFDFIQEAIGVEGFPNLDYVSFKEFCYASKVSKEEYESVIQKLQTFPFVDFESFRENVDTELFTKHYFLKVEE